MFNPFETKLCRLAESCDALGSKNASAPKTESIFGADANAHPNVRTVFPCIGGYFWIGISSTRCPMA